MSYESVDQLQKVLARDVFHYAKDAKKAAGRALGTLVEIITFYLLKTWGFEKSVELERSLGEYGNPEITHNVEYSLHPILRQSEMPVAPILPLTSSRLWKAARISQSLTDDFTRTMAQLLTKDELLRNACTFARSTTSRLVATINERLDDTFSLTIAEHYVKPFAIIECKRVGIEEGMRKGPQTIEKAKQGAYVANAVSALHKIRSSDGSLNGLIYKPDGSLYVRPYSQLLREIVASDEPGLLRDFILTVGVVSNHGNWFTSDNHNKELKVLAQAYDWLVFLTDEGLAIFITDLLLNPTPLLQAARTAFLKSYTVDKTGNRFTKVRIEYAADQVLQRYFSENLTAVEKWFNVISPANEPISNLHAELSLLRNKNWTQVYGI